MKIQLIYVGKTNTSYLIEGEREYYKRLKHYAPFEIVEIPDIKNTKNKSKESIKIEEGKAIISQLSSSDYVILLDEKGKEFTSQNFSKYMQKQFLSGYQRLIFIIGGSYGFSDEVYQLAKAKVALSQMTFSHQMIRLFFLEQLYRSFTILKGEPYHHQ